MQLKKLFAVLFVSVLLCCATPVFAIESNSLSWYCVRNKEHLQPCADANMAFIEKYGGIYVDRSHGNTNPQKVVYLTFDAGYENGNVEKILNILKEKQTPGTFFILGNLIKQNPDLVRRMADEGHVVANHTNHHKDMTRIDSIENFREELQSLELLYHQATGREMVRLYRPPEGKFNLRSMEYAHSLGYKTVFWSLAYADWDNNNQPTPSFAKKKIFDNVHNGAIILLHPTSAVNATILGDVIDTLREQGYRFGSLSEIIK